MKTVGEEHAFTQQALISGIEFNLGDRKSVSKMQATVHVREREVSKPFGVLFLNFSRC